MFCENKLKGKIAEKGMNLGSLSEATGIKYYTMLRKVCGTSEFDRDEISLIAKALDLSHDDIINIFFAE